MKLFKRKKRLQLERILKIAIAKDRKLKLENDKKIAKEVKRMLGEVDDERVTSMEEKYSSMMLLERESHNDIVVDLQLGARAEAMKYKKQYDEKLNDLEIKETKYRQRIKRLKEKEHKLFEISKELARQITTNESVVNNIAGSIAGFEENKRLNKNLTKQISNEMED